MEWMISRPTSPASATELATAIDSSLAAPPHPARARQPDRHGRRRRRAAVRRDHGSPAPSGDVVRVAPGADVQGAAAPPGNKSETVRLRCGQPEHGRPRQQLRRGQPADGGLGARAAQRLTWRRLSPPPDEPSADPWTSARDVARSEVAAALAPRRRVCPSCGHIEDSASGRCSACGADLVARRPRRRIGRRRAAARGARARGRVALVVAVTAPLRRQAAERGPRARPRASGESRPPRSAACARDAQPHRATGRPRRAARTRSRTAARSSRRRRPSSRATRRPACAPAR